MAAATARAFCRALGPSGLAMLVFASACADCAKAPPPPARAALAPAVPAAPVAAPSATPPVDSSTLDEPRLPPEDVARFDAAVQGALDRGEVPGAVLIVVRAGSVVLRKAYGLRAREPRAVPMTVDTVFDLASLTKPIATASAVLWLVERGKLKLSDPARRWLPEFQGGDRDRITVEQLLLHTAGLPADNALADYQDGPARALGRLQRLPLLRPPGEAHLYSDIGYILLGAIVERVAGEPLDAFAQKNLFAPLGMRDTGFRPGSALADRAAPTERDGGAFLQGIVHDPRARALGGVAGHAGLFSTADDLARFARMILGGGELDGRRILARRTIEALTAMRPLPGAESAESEGGRLRALGFGPMFGGAGHTGFTGTALWLDMRRGDAVVLLSSRLHPDGKGDATRLRRDVARVMTELATARRTPVQVGIDILERDGFKILEGRRIGLITNPTGRDARGQRTVDLLAHAPGARLVALFAPEHGIDGDHDEAFEGGVDKATGLPVHSLYGATRRPTEAQLAGIDTLVYDIQDAGCRFYTYISTLGYALEEAARRKIHFVVLDRPNPLGGLSMEGPLLDPGRASFVAYHSIPLRHGMTVGELARLFVAERKLDVDLVVVPMEGFRRADLFERTGLSWVRPSPNLKSPRAALLYPGIGLLEMTNLSVGRGTETPFLVVGAPWLDGARLISALGSEGLAGVRFSPVRFRPEASAYAGQECGGVAIEVVFPDEVAPVRIGLALARALLTTHAGSWKPEGMRTLLGSQRVYDALVGGEPLAQILSMIDEDLRVFARRRAPYLLYR
jgi:uncharacterized protein YbbC (DUF1343 family)/CubicO group peptidase (beta-lactamase class C family)